MRPAAWQCSLMAATCPAAGQAQWAHSHLHISAGKVPVVLRGLWSLCCSQWGDSLWGRTPRARGSRHRCFRWLSVFFFFTAKGLCFLDRPKCWIVRRSLEASYKVLIETKMTQKPPSLRVLFHSSPLSLPRLVSAKVSISQRGTETVVHLMPGTQYLSGNRTTENGAGSFSYHNMNINSSCQPEQ